MSGLVARRICGFTTPADADILRPCIGEWHAGTKDAAQCLFQRSLTEARAVKKLVPRKPNENQKRTRYSKSNLAYIYKNKTELEVLENNKRFMKDLKRYYRSIDDLANELD